MTKSDLIDLLAADQSTLGQRDVELAVKAMLKQAESARAKLGENMRPGSARRPTGSIYPDSPVISHPRDWGMVPAGIVNGLDAERKRRHPEWKPNARGKK